MSASSSASLSISISPPISSLPLPDSGHFINVAGTPRLVKPMSASSSLTAAVSSSLPPASPRLALPLPRQTASVAASSSVSSSTESDLLLWREILDRPSTKEGRSWDLNELKFLMSKKELFNAILPKEMIGPFIKIVDGLRAVELKLLLSSDWFKTQENVKQLLVENCRLPSYRIFAIRVLMTLDSFKKLGSSRGIQDEILENRLIPRPEELEYFEQLEPNLNSVLGQETPPLVEILKRIFAAGSEEQVSIQTTISKKIEELSQLQQSSAEKAKALKPEIDKIQAALEALPHSCEEVWVKRIVDPLQAHVRYQLKRLSSEQAWSPATYERLSNYWVRANALSTQLAQENGGDEL